jgi:hypothetical protein
VDISFQDDVTVILLLGVSFMVGDQSGMHRENIRGGQYRCREQSINLPTLSLATHSPSTAKEVKRVVF